MNEKIEKYAEYRKEALELYNTFGKVSCSALGNEFVHFTSEGFNHLVYKRKKKPRDERVQIMKFDLLNRAKDLLELSTTFQEYEEDFQYIRVQKHGKKSFDNTVVRYWGFVAIIKKFRIKVVVKQVGNGKKEFFSVIPAWFTKQYRNIKLIETSTKGGLSLEHDEEALKNTTKGGAF